VTRRPGVGWLAAHGHRVPVAGTFVDPERFRGTMYRAAGRERLGRAKGYARANGRHADPHGAPKGIPVRALRPGARRPACPLRARSSPT